MKVNKSNDDQQFVLPDNDGYLSSAAYVDRYEQAIAELENKLPKPKYQVGDILLADGFRKVEVKEVLVKDKKHWWSKKHKFTFAYVVENVLTESVRTVKDGITYVSSFSKASTIFKEEELQEVPDNYETYLCHIIYNLTHEERK